ncbi:hypothetical protein TKK_0010285 [Trichogramma kaykai]
MDSRNLVKKYPEIWGVTNISCGNKILKEHIWLDISKKLNEEGELCLYDSGTKKSNQKGQTEKVRPQGSNPRKVKHQKCPIDLFIIVTFLSLTF